MPGEALFFSQGLRFFYRFRKTLKKLHLFCTKAIPSKEVWVPIKTWGASLSPGCNYSLHTSFILCSLPTSEWRDQGRATWTLGSVFPRNTGSGQCVLTWHQDHSSHCLGEVLRFSSGPAFTVSPPLLLFLADSRLSNTSIFAPFFPHLKRLQFYWCLILHPGLKEMITKCFW